MPLIVLSCAWVAGIFLGSRFDLPPALILTGLLPLPLLFRLPHQRKAIIVSSLALITLFAAVPYAYSSLHKWDANSLRFYNGAIIQVKGMVTGDPEPRARVTRLVISAAEVKTGEGWRAVRGKALLTVPNYPTYRYGDVLIASGRLETPQGAGDFDYEGYLANQGVHSTMAYPKLQVEARGQGFPVLQWVHSLRGDLSQALARALPEPQASLAQGIVLGLRSGIPAALNDSFYRTGTTHILAISGMNLGIVAGLLVAIGLWLFGRRRYIYVWLALGGIWLYTLLTGMQPPVLRAAIMASLFLAAELLGRQRSAMTALAFAAAVMVGITPYVLWDVSFQLSFLAMAGLVLLVPILQPLGRRAATALAGEEGVKATIVATTSDAFCVTLAATIAVWPVIAHNFGAISPIGPLATVLLVPALPGIMVTGALTGIIGLVAPPAAVVVGWLAWPLLSYMVLIVTVLAAPWLASLALDPIDGAWIAAYYFVLAGAIWLKGAWPRLEVTTRLKNGAGAACSLAGTVPGRWVIPPLLLAAIAATSIAATMPDDKVHVSFLDVGEGDAVLIQKGQHQVLIDGGPSAQAISRQLGSRMPFWDRSIDVLVLTHPHSDHLTGLLEVLRRFRVARVLAAESAYNSATYAEWQRLIREKGVDSVAARNGQQIDLGGGTTIQVFYPSPSAGERQEDIDNNSLVLRLVAGKSSFLLTADAPQAAEMELVRQRVGLASTVLKVGHHGSATSSSAAFLAAVDPQVAVISVGEGNSSGHPDTNVMKRLEDRLGPGKVYRTDKNGAIDFVTDGRRLRLTTEKGEGVTK